MLLDLEDSLQNWTSAFGNNHRDTGENNSSSIKYDNKNWIVLFSIKLLL